jgi:hypothetical protein
MIRLAIVVDDIDNVIAAGYTQYYVFTDTSSTGAFATQDGTGTLVAQTQGYTHIDTDGTTGTYYKVSYWGTTPGTSSKSATLLGGTVQYYATALDVRQELVAGASNDAAMGEFDDDVIWDMCEEASRLIDDYKRVEHGAYLAGTSTSARYFSGSGRNRQRIDPFVSVSSVEVEETDGTYTTWTADTDYYTWPWDASSKDEPIIALYVSRKSGSSKSVFTNGPQRVRVTGVPGVSASVPPAVRRAARIQVARWYKRAQQGWQDSSANIELGQLTFVQELDPDIRMVLRGAFPTGGAGI